MKFDITNSEIGHFWGQRSSHSPRNSPIWRYLWVPRTVCAWAFFLLFAGASSSRFVSWHPSSDHLGLWKWEEIEEIGQKWWNNFHENDDQHWSWEIFTWFYRLDPPSSPNLPLLVDPGSSAMTTFFPSTFLGVAVVGKKVRPRHTVYHQVVWTAIIYLPTYCWIYIRLNWYLILALD